MKRISVEVVLALPEQQELRRVALPENSTVADALRASGLPAQFPRIDASRVGIYGRRAALGTGLRDGDRVEIYRALKIDPKEVRLRRAKKAGTKE